MRVIVVGAGPIGLATASIFARAGVETTLLDRDPEPPPGGPADVWHNWARPGVAQFRQAHLLLPLGRSVLDDRLPDAVSTLRTQGAYTVNPAHHPPQSLDDWTPEPGDERHEIVNARRPVVEAALSGAAERIGYLDIRRGVGIDELLVGPSAADGLTHIGGVRTTTGESLRADLVVDAMGRRSRMPDMLEDAGARRPREEAEDSRFVYYTQFFRADGAGVPEPFAPGLYPLGSVSILLIPADNGTWSVTLYTSSSDRAMRAAKDPEVQRRVVAAHHGFADWVRGESEGEINVMAGVVDRQRFFVDDAGPVATGVVPVGDAWACTNPSLGRGISLGLKQAALTVDAALDNAGDPKALVEACDRATREQMEPWHKATLEVDRARVAEMEAIVAGSEPPEDQDSFAGAVSVASSKSSDIFRRALEVSGLFRTPREAFGDQGVRDVVMELAGDENPSPSPHPTRQELLALVG